MTSGPTRLLAALLLLATARTHAAPPEPIDAGWILQRLARPAPMRTAFVELRASRLLKAPLRVEGEYRRPAERVLVREVKRPYAETTEIRDGSVAITRSGRTQRHSLDRAPELAALQASFGALLSGDRATLERHFLVAASGTRPHWTLRLTPRTRSARMQAVVLHGRGAELRCIETQPQAGTVQRTLLAGAAQAAATVTAPTALAALCSAPPG